MELEKKALAGIIKFLEGQEGEKLKKHPKLMAMQIEVEKKPELDMKKIEEKSDAPEMEDSESEMSAEDLTPEMIQKLLEMHKNLK